MRQLREQISESDDSAEPDWTEAETVSYLTNLSEPELMVLLQTVRKTRQIQQGFRTIDALSDPPD